MNIPTGTKEEEEIYIYILIVKCFPTFVFAILTKFSYVLKRQYIKLVFLLRNMSFEKTFFFLQETLPEDLLIDPVWNSLENLKNYFSKNSLGNFLSILHEQVYLKKKERIFIGKNTQVEPGANIEGPCVIGNDCIVRHNAYIRGNVVIGNRCIIGHGTEIKNSILLENVHAAHFAYIGDSIIGNNVNIGAGVVLANLRLDKKNIKISFFEELLDTGLKKLGSIIGDDSQIGCNSVLNPGTILGPNSLCPPCLSISGFFPKNSSIRTNKGNFSYE